MRALSVMAGLDAAIHVFAAATVKTWMPGTSPGMTSLTSSKTDNARWT